MKAINNFKIISYLNPTWYFNLEPFDTRGYSACILNSKFLNLPGSAKGFAERDGRYSSEEAAELDTGYRLWHCGYLLYPEGIKPEEYFEEVRLTKEDEYVFARKYFRKKFVYYFFLRNIFGFSNPFKEIKAFFKTNKIVKEDYLRGVYGYEDYNGFNSMLLQSEPLVSIIIPTLNRYKYLKDVMNDLEKQDHKNFEVIVSDQSESPDKDFYGQFDLKIELIFQKEKGQWLARNEAIRKAKGDYLLFFDDDSRVDPDWISEHLKCLDYFNADISAGISLSVTGDKVPENYSYFRWADQFDSGNALVKKEVFYKTGLFDRQFDGQRMGDGEFGLRVYLNGFRSISNPFAKRIHLKVSSGGLRQMGSWDAFRPKNFFAPRPVPSVLYFFRKYYPGEYVKNALILRLFPSLIPYKWKGRKIFYPLLIPAVMILFPIIILQLTISWRKSSGMLREGDRIEKLV